MSHFDGDLYSLKKPKVRVLLNDDSDSDDLSIIPKPNPSKLLKIDKSMKREKNVRLKNSNFDASEFSDFEDSDLNISQVSQSSIPEKDKNVDQLLISSDDEILTETLEETLMKCGKISKKKIPGTKRRKSGANKAIKLLQKVKKTIEIPCDDIMITPEREPLHEVFELKVAFFDCINRFKVNKNKLLINLVQEISDLKKVSCSQVKLIFDDRVLSHVNTPSFYDLNITSIVDCSISKKKNMDFTNPNNISVAVQDNKVSNRNKKTIINISKTDKMQIVFDEYAKVRNLDGSRLKFYFDGERIDGNETAVDCDIEDGYCIDVVL